MHSPHPGSEPLGEATPQAPTRCYLDNAATSWPKPDAVYTAIDAYQRNVGAAAGRGVYSSADEARQVVDRARRSVARLLNAVDARQIIFAQNGTDALNLALHGLLRRTPGHVVTTVTEHNSVLRPLRALCDAGLAQVTYVGCNAKGYVDPGEVEQAIRPDTRLVVICHASNVTGALQPLAEITAAAHRHGIPVLVDAAQSAGETLIDVQALEIDLLAAPGHKGLLGPLGTGVLYIRPGLETQLEPLRQGGTGTDSDDERQPATMPERFEAGNLNVPALAGLGTGVEWLHKRLIEGAFAEHQAMLARFVAHLGAIRGVRLLGPRTMERRMPVFSVVSEVYTPQELAAALDSAYGVQLRAGLHCAPRMHAALGTLNAGGTVRLGPGRFTTEAELDTAIRALEELHAG
ncbi:MAG: aminotransferase class V-fold PLP-dependent enzyme [Planctomycetes bacterium]|nr:aminotransferase class V-fold PLP-dependent enzyme [Planctomycetota bacterium]